MLLNTSLLGRIYGWPAASFEIMLADIFCKRVLSFGRDKTIVHILSNVLNFCGPSYRSICCYCTWHSEVPMQIESALKNDTWTIMNHTFYNFYSGGIYAEVVAQAGKITLQDFRISFQGFQPSYHCAVCLFTFIVLSQYWSSSERVLVLGFKHWTLTKPMELETAGISELQPYLDCSLSSE